MEANNKLIAEFMGIDSFKDSLASLHQGKINVDVDVYEQAQYNTSWDWLMPVVQKCLRTGDNTDEWDNIFDALSLLSINAVYEEVVEFIKNQNN
jgi:hypothetical protein